MGLIHWVFTYAGAYAWAPLGSKGLRERFSLLGTYADAYAGYCHQL